MTMGCPCSLLFLSYQPKIPRLEKTSCNPSSSSCSKCKFMDSPIILWSQVGNCVDKRPKRVLYHSQFWLKSCCSTDNSKSGCIVHLTLLLFSFILSNTMPGIGIDKNSWQVQASVISDNTLLRRYIVTHGKAILRYALPIPIDEPIRGLQSTLEQLLIDLHSPGKSGISLAWKDIQKAKPILHRGEVEILLDTRKEHRDEAAVALGDVDQLLESIQEKIKVTKNSKKALKDMKNEIAQQTESTLDKIAQLEEWMVQGFPYPIPHKYDSLPRLKGRATVEMTVTKANHPTVDSSSLFRDKNGSPIGNSIHLVAILDGYSAPLTSGNFIQALLNNIYQNATIVHKESGFYLFVQPKQLLIDSNTKKPRHIPMEVLVDGDPYPIWGKTLETADLADLQPVLPMTAFGALAMVHSSEDENDANSSFFIFTLDPRSEQARNKGGNVLNGNVATFGYIVEGLEYLLQISPNDTITHTRILNGMDKWEP
ncbi:hypothetical protein GpartN1_g4163.t1 [Galdieria partita]|uniref:peptidylprolyl isomerase n=1 Tax=Galdieria partita TaxID=83374 RepID=A0A9C7PZI0_9RHOD|nr:hypothetical protein GpartN1_g4163.t1 [Galdieria partita]